MTTHLDPALTAAYLDQGLGPDERERAAAHLADCAECRARLAAQVRAEQRGALTPMAARGPRTAWVPLLAAAAVGALLLGVGLWYAAGDRHDRLAERGPSADDPSFPPDTAAAAADTGTGSLEGSEAPAPGVRPAPGELAERPRGTPEPEPRAEREPPAEELLALRGARRVVEGKTFRLQGDTWVDASYRARDHGAPRDVRRGTGEYQELAVRDPRLARWTAIGPRVLVLVDSIPYRLLPPGD